jgi:hypothetical protein
MADTDKNISLNINLSKIGKWIQTHVYWAATIFFGFLWWRAASTAWGMAKEQWECPRGPMMFFLLLITTVLTLVFGINAIVEAHDRSKRSY